ncbi:hypothetical protein [Okeania sp. SIO2B3]|uniref:hypothetical protein n=1 Tax=Okeania sp. SIO2B3 TaxID=2607784 RepID=UPI0013BEC348|nr:hypothetical protein [Okeania sp. SIO2B3]NET40609.1 hypothetical protein [Okeania sp. SIO2B3]
MSNYKNYDGKIASKLTDEKIQTFELGVKYGTTKLQAGEDDKILKGICKVEIKDNAIVLLGYFELDSFNFCKNIPDGKDSEGKTKWKKEPVPVDAGKIHCIIIPSEIYGKEVTDFSVFKVVFEKILSSSGDIKVFDLQFPLHSLYYDEYYKSELKLHGDPSFNTPDIDWQALTVSKGSRPPRIIITEATGDKAQEILSSSPPDVSASSKKNYSYGESTTEKLKSRLEFLKSNSSGIKEVAEGLGVEIGIVLRALMS